MFITSLPRKRVRTPFRMTRSVYEAIKATVGRHPAETGGILGGSRSDGVVRYYHFDTAARRSGASYSPHTDSLNALLRNQWNPRGINMLGFVHSHPLYVRGLSTGDLSYARRILQWNEEIERLLLPIVFHQPDGGQFRLHAYSVVRDKRRRNRVHIELHDLELVEDEAATKVEEARPAAVPATAAAPDATHPEPEQAASSRPDTPQTNAILPVLDGGGPPNQIDLCETFRRVRDAYDLGRLASCRVIVVGNGGAAQFIEELARAGVGEFVPIDPDVVSETNLATQQAYRRDIGRPKVECLKERILDVNPNALVEVRQQRLEEIDDRDFQQLATAPWKQWTATLRGIWGLPGADVPVEVAVPPSVTLLCGLTDNFEAQARVNRLALQFGLPSLCAQVYHEGRGAEITFTYPGVTPACHRCALRSRYEAYLNNGFRNNVGSDGTPIFATTRLNALKGFITLALLHHGSAHPRWGGMLERIGNRSLVQIRMDPDVSLPVFERVFGGGDQQRILCDDAVWLPQQPDCPENGFPTCPDCGGTGDLRCAKGTFNDTRPMRR